MCMIENDEELVNNYSRPAVNSALNTLLGVTQQVAVKLIAMRDALAKNDIDEAYHLLYSIASPGFDEYSPWDKLEELAKNA